MKTLRTILVACAIGVGLAACGDATRIVAPGYDGGFTAGGGHRMMSSDTSTTAAPSPTGGTTGETPAERGGGFTIGSGG